MCCVELPSYDDLQTFTENLVRGLISCLQVDSKVDEMRSICTYKDAQIEELRSRLNRAVLATGSRADTEASRQNIAVLSKAIKERDEQIDKLQDQLKDASK